MLVVSLYVGMLMGTLQEPSGQRPGGRRDQKTTIRTLAGSLPQNPLRNRVSTQPRSIPAGQVGRDSEVTKSDSEATPRVPRAIRPNSIRTDPQRPPVAPAAKGQDRACQWTWHRAPRHPHDPAVLGPAEVVGIPQGPPVLLRRRPRFIQRWGWRGDQGARSKTRTSVSSPLASVRLDSSASRAASPFCNLWPLTVSAPRATCT